jgi:alkanesulfonate monooxygenase SsuD/methylene tetrahydromethanopterin reductase-like flavin-dependent oxidoreductase (luciferase family)
MKIGVALAQTSWPDGRVFSLAEIEEYGLRAEAAGFDSVWSNDHFFLETHGPRRVQGGEPLALLAHLAARTERVELGTLVACARFRSVGQLAREAKTIAELSGGRFILGLGAGWHDPELEAFGIESDRLYSRLEEYVEALVALFAGGRVDYEGRYVRLRGAEVAGSAAPPLWIGASAPKALDLLARHADGWNLGGPKERFAELVPVVRAGEARAGRPEGSVTASTGAVALLVPEDEGERLLAQHPPTMGAVTVGADGLRALVEEYRTLGCEHLILHLSGSIWSSYGLDQLDLAADALGLG